MEQTNIHINQEDEESMIDDEMETLGETIIKDTLKRKQKVNSIASISKLWMKPHSISRLMIPLCCISAMPMVRPAL